MKPAKSPKQRRTGTNRYGCFVTDCTKKPMRVADAHVLGIRAILGHHAVRIVGDEAHGGAAFDLDRGLIVDVERRLANAVVAVGGRDRVEKVVLERGRNLHAVRVVRSTEGIVRLGLASDIEAVGR
jgi:hypothetical protein